MKLYEISNKYQLTFNKLENAEEVNETDIENELMPIKDEFENKAIAVSSFIKNLEAEAIAIKQAEFNMAQRRKVIENRIASFKNYLLSNMERCDFTQVKCPYFSIKIKDCPESVEITDINKIPDEYMRVKTIKEPDKAKIKEYLQQPFESEKLDSDGDVNNKELFLMSRKLINFGAILKRNKTLQIK